MDGEKTTRNLNCILDADLYNAFKRKTFLKDLKMSDVIREFVENYVKGEN